MLTSLNLLCLRARDPERLVRFYERLGLSFHQEQHGTGPIHFACDLGGSVFEIYPLSNNQPPTVATRIGFRVSSLQEAIEHLDANGTSIGKPKHTEYGRVLVLEDPEGHKVELVEPKRRDALSPRSAQMAIA